MLKSSRQHKKSVLNWRRLLVAGLLSGTTANLAFAQDYPPLPNPGEIAAQQMSQQTQAKLRVYDVPPELVGTIGSQLQLQFHGNSDVSVTTGPEGGQLMVMAPPSIQQTVAYQVSELLKRGNLANETANSGIASTRERSYGLRNLSWRELEDALRTLAGPRLSITTDRNGEVANLRILSTSGRNDVLQIDRRNNEVTLVGSSESLNGWEQIIYSLDQGQADPSRSTHVVPLAPAKPRSIRSAIRLVNATVQQATGGGQAEAQVDLGDDDQATAMGTIDSLGSDSGLFGDVQIEFVEEIDLVIIRGSKRDVQRTLEVIEKIKAQAKETQPLVEVLQLKHANAEAVEALVADLYAEIFEPRQGSVSITALGQPNALLLIGRDEVIASVKSLIAKIDLPLDATDQLKVIRLQHASSEDVANRIREFFTQSPPDGDEGRIGIETRVKVLSDYRTNSLIVQASPREMVELEGLIEELDTEDSTTENSVKVFPLQNTLAEDLQTVIQDIIGGQTTGADEALATPTSGKLSMVTVDGGKIESGILAGVIITADTTNNNLVVRAPAPSMALIGKLIQELDQTPSAEAVIKVFQLTNGDATTLAQTLQGLFGLQVTAGQGAQSNFLNNLGANTLTAGGESSLIQLNIAAEARTNSVIVSGSRSDLKVIEALVLRLDEDVVESRRAEV
ncbi:MAG: secretin N-terminal domain-containing protein, partial [Planctomycetota bacterium]